MRISDWSSDVCLFRSWQHVQAGNEAYEAERFDEALEEYRQAADARPEDAAINYNVANALHRLSRLDEAAAAAEQARVFAEAADDGERSEEHTSELQSLMRISYAVFCLKKKIIVHPTLLTKA